MAAPGFYDDRALAEKAAWDHRAVTGEVAELIRQWEALQAEAEVQG